MTRISFYYVLNYKRFSHQAAYSQSNRQLRSAGSPIIGISYSHNKMGMDWDKFANMVSDINKIEYTSNTLYGKQKNDEFSFSGGYGYNWVFAKNWLLGASLSLALAYKWSSGDTNQPADDFSFKNINLDGVGRLGIVWNNTKWYYGANAIIHSYNYSKPRFSANNVFGSLNIYCGFNFGLKKSYRKKR